MGGNNLFLQKPTCFYVPASLKVVKKGVQVSPIKHEEDEKAVLWTRHVVAHVSFHTLRTAEFRKTRRPALSKGTQEDHLRLKIIDLLEVDLTSSLIAVPKWIESRTICTTIFQVEDKAIWFLFDRASSIR